MLKYSNRSGGALFCRCSVSSSRSFLSRLSIYPLFSHHALFLSNILTMFNWKYVECLLFRISSYVNSISSVRLHKVCAREAEQQQKKVEEHRRNARNRKKSPFALLVLSVAVVRPQQCEYLISIKVNTVIIMGWSRVHRQIQCSCREQQWNDAKPIPSKWMIAITKMQHVYQLAVDVQHFGIHAKLAL